MGLSSYTSSTDRGTIPDHAQPKIVFVPDQLYQTLMLTNEPLSKLLDLNEMVNLIGPQALATFAYANSLYDSGNDIFLKHELMSGFIKFDLFDKYRDDLIGNEGLRDIYAHTVKKYEGLLLSKPTLPEAYIRSQGDNNANAMEIHSEHAVQYYVPEMFVICERIYGVRLKAITGLANTTKTVLKQTTVANLGLLGNSYDIQQLARFDLFKQFVALC